MRYIHVKNLEKYHPGYREEITSEYHLERVILGYWDDIFPFNNTAIRKKISKRSIVDMLGENDEYTYVIELKYRPKRQRDIKQLNRYERDLKKIITRKIRKILIDYNHFNGDINIWKVWA
jgi:RecB family endonuclease NucS